MPAVPQSKEFPRLPESAEGETGGTTSLGGVDGLQANPLALVRIAHEP